MNRIATFAEMRDDGSCRSALVFTGEKLTVHQQLGKALQCSVGLRIRNFERSRSVLP